MPRRTKLLVCISLLNACGDVDSECVGYVRYEMEVSPLSNKVTVGQDIYLQFDLYGEDRLVVDVFDDPLCGLRLTAAPRPPDAVTATRPYVDGESRPPDKTPLEPN